MNHKIIDVMKFGNGKEPSSGPREKCPSTEAAQDVLDAMKDNDVEAFRLALKFFVRECSDHDAEDDTDTED